VNPKTWQLGRYELDRAACSDSKGVKNIRAEDAKNDRSTDERSEGLPNARIATDNASCGHLHFARTAWRHFRCHVRREALDLA
jgi:hypothetical protein